MVRYLSFAALACLVMNGALARDVLQADPKHAKLEYQNSRLRVIRLKVGPHETVPMHTHPDRVIVNLTDVNVKITLPDGQSGQSSSPAGQTNFSRAVTHAGENTGDATWEVIEVELKTKATHSRETLRGRSEQDFRE